MSKAFLGIDCSWGSIVPGDDCSWWSIVPGDRSFQVIDRSWGSIFLSGERTKISRPMPTIRKKDRTHRTGSHKYQDYLQITNVEQTVIGWNEPCHPELNFVCVLLWSEVHWPKKYWVLMESGLDRSIRNTF